MRFRIIATVVLAFTSSAFASETYKFDQSHSTIAFSVHQFLGTTDGRFAKFDGKIEIDRENPGNSSVTARIDVRSIDTGIAKRDNHLRSAEFFSVEKYPEIVFKSRSVKRTGAQAGDIVGDLTMHGVTRPVTLHVKLVTSVDDVKQTRWSVTTDPLKRRDFNLMFNQTAESLSGISQTVEVKIDIVASRSQ
jgi:polyisoprenoid-binding protein YceI